jgi:CHAT domain-containing protein/Tfp pilus assembly protein PilF
MTYILRICLMSLTCFVLVSAALAQTANSLPLVLNQPTEHELKGGEGQFFTLSIGANQTARVEVEQKGIDIALAAYKPDGERFIETESPNGILGKDWILVTAAQAGEYKIAVESIDPKALPGKFQIKLAEIRPSVAQDFEINLAAEQINSLGGETSELRQKGTRESRLLALEKFQEVVRLSKIKQDKNWEIVAIISSGLIYDQLGELQKSLDFYLRGLILSREEGSREYIAASLNNLGNEYRIIGDYEQSVFYLNQALEIDREIGDKQGEGIVLNNLGNCYVLLGDLTKAEQLLRQSIPLRREIKDQKGEGNTLNNLGLVFARNSDQTKAIDFFQQALALRRTTGDKAGEAITLRNLGRSYWDSGDKLKAEEYFEQSNQMARQLGDRRVEADTFYRLALIERENGNLPKAFENAESGLQIIERIRGELVNPDLRTAYFSTVQQFYELYAEILVARYEKTKDETDAALALQISERARTRSLVELLQEANVNIRQGVDVKTLEQAQDLQNSLNQKYRQRTQALSRKSTEEQIAKITGEINSLSSDLENLQVKIRRDNPAYADLTQGASLSAREIQNLLDDETVLLEYKLGVTRSFLWLVTKDSVKIFTLPARAEIETIARDFYGALTNRTKESEFFAADLSKKLSNILLSPVAGELGNKRIAVVADGVLQFIPFAALQVQNSKSQASRFLVETNEIVALPSASVLAQLRRSSVNRKTPGKTIAIFADAVFEADDTRLSGVSKNIKPAEKSAEIAKVLRDSAQDENLPRLLSTRVEAKTISAFAAKNQTMLEMDFDASRENVSSDALADYRILHFATHGFLDTSRPELSGLVLSLYDKDGKAQDGFLRLNQIYNLNLNSDLVVLSACQTALGKDVRGEGLIGLTRGFMYAGAKRIVASLWKVDDAATAEFMKRFYQNLLQKKLTAVAALKQAQTEMMQIPRFKSAYFWAGFTLQGEWKESEK